jgi:hypothetical protein
MLPSNIGSRIPGTSGEPAKNRLHRSTLEEAVQAF